MTLSVGGMLNTNIHILYFSAKTYVVGTQKSHLNVTDHLQMLKLIDKIIFMIIIFFIYTYDPVFLYKT